jgi:hypothetical protein
LSQPHRHPRIVAARPDVEPAALPARGSRLFAVVLTLLFAVPQLGWMAFLAYVVWDALG